MAFDDRTQEQNGTVLGTMAAGAVAIPTYAIVMRGIRGSMRSAASTVQPAKVESFAQLARSIAPGYVHESYQPAYFPWVRKVQQGS